MREAAPNTILVVEDNPDNMKLVTWILEDEGFNVVGAETAEDGLEILGNQAFDLILMDISLPGMDGKEATRKIRQDPVYNAYKELPVVALTAHAAKEEHEAIMQSGATDLISKPIDEEVFIRQVRKLLSH